MSEVRGRSLEDPMPEGRRPRGVTPCLRSGQRPRVPDCDSTGTAERSYPASEVRGGGPEELPHTPKPEVRGGGGEEQPRPEARGGGQEKQSQVRGQGRRPGGPTPHPRSCSCAMV